MENDRGKKKKNRKIKKITMNKSILKISNFSKANFIIIFSFVILFFLSFGIINFTNVSATEKPRWFICDHKKSEYRSAKDPLYIKFHKTNKVQWDRKKAKWVKSKHKGLRDLMPTIEMNEDKLWFNDSSKGQFKLLPIYESEKFYVFYQTTGGWSYLKGVAPDKLMAQHIIINREDLSLLFYENEWIRSEYRVRDYNDNEINKLFKEAENYYGFLYEDIPLLNGDILKAEKSLEIFKCKEIPEIKPKI